jgi:fibronectin type 3 domain-containing protein
LDIVVKERSPEFSVYRFMSLLLSMALVSCAKVGDPLPPISAVPASPSSLQLIQVGHREVILDFELDSVDIRQIEVFRSCGGEIASPIALVGVEDLGEGSRSGARAFTDPQPEFGQKCRYWVRLIGKGGKRSAESEIVETVSLSPARAPSGLKATVRADSILVQWEVPKEDINGAVPEVLEGFLVNAVAEVTGPQYVDRDFVFGAPKTYRVQSISRIRSPRVLSDFSTPLTVIPEDTFAPESPANLSGIIVNSSVQLVWDASGDSDLAGYYIYRKTDEKYLRFSPLVAVSRYLDETPPSGVSLDYFVTAVDKSGNESDPSISVSVAGRSED